MDTSQEETNDMIISDNSPTVASLSLRTALDVPMEDNQKMDSVQLLAARLVSSRDSSAHHHHHYAAASSASRMPTTTTTTTIYNQSPSPLSSERSPNNSPYQMAPAAGYPHPHTRSSAPNPNDVICARGKKAYNHPGNQRFREMIRSRMSEYNATTTKLERSIIVSEIIQSVRQSGGAFVRRVEDPQQQQQGDLWQDLGDSAGREKVGQGFRDLLHTKYKSSTKAKRLVKRQQKQQQKQHQQGKMDPEEHKQQTQQQQQQQQEGQQESDDDEQTNSCSSTVAGGAGGSATSASTGAARTTTKKAPPPLSSSPSLVAQMLTTPLPAPTPSAAAGFPMAHHMGPSEPTRTFQPSSATPFQPMTGAGPLSLLQPASSPPPQQQQETSSCPWGEDLATASSGLDDSQLASIFQTANRECLRQIKHNTATVAAAGTNNPNNPEDTDMADPLQQQQQQEASLVALDAALLLPPNLWHAIQWHAHNCSVCCQPQQLSFNDDDEQLEGNNNPNNNG